MYLYHQKGKKNLKVTKERLCHQESTATYLRARPHDRRNGNEGIRNLTVGRERNLLLQLDSYNQVRVPMSREGIRECDECP